MPGGGKTEERRGGMESGGGEESGIGGMESSGGESSRGEMMEEESCRGGEEAASRSGEWRRESSRGGMMEESWRGSCITQWRAADGGEERDGGEMEESCR